MNAEQQAAVKRLTNTRIDDLRDMGGLKRAGHIIDLSNILSLITELTKDKARLNHLQNHCAYAVPGTDFPGWGIEGTVEDRQLPTDQTLRQAIDAAMEEAKRPHNPDRHLEEIDDNGERSDL